MRIMNNEGYLWVSLSVWALVLLSRASHAFFVRPFILLRPESSTQQSYVPSIRSTIYSPSRIQLISNGIDYSFLSSNDRDNCIGKEEILNQEQLEFITDLVNRRSDARKNGDYELADLIRENINALQQKKQSTKNANNNCDDVVSSVHERSFLPEGYIVEIKDIPRKDGCGSTWSLQLEDKEPIDWVEPQSVEDRNDIDEIIDSSSVLKIAHSALGLASWSSENRVPINQEELNNLVYQAKKRLLRTGSRELRGRKAADAAFWFAMAGVKDDVNMNTKEGDQEDIHFSLFDALTFICIDELQRFGKRASCRATDVMHMVERIAASGVRSEMSIELQKVAAECLLTKKDIASSNLNDRGIITSLQRGKFHLHSEHPLLWIWRFSTRQRKQQAFLKSASKHWESKSGVNITQEQSSAFNLESVDSALVDWEEIFDDPTKPLVLDIGCGMGISLLGLASLSNQAKQIQENSFLDINWSNCNFVGADLSQLAINYASSISHRWKLKGKVHFEVISAENIVQEILKSYPGEIQLVLIQFPTPFSFQEVVDDDINADEEKNDQNLQSVVRQGNKQLPSSAVKGFMVTKHLLDLVHKGLESSAGRLILQSNCEDVAVYMKNIATDEVGFEAINVPCSVDSSSDENAITMRTEKWIAKGGERAVGSCWSREQILPSLGSTETEIACEMNGIPIHRCILQTNIKI